MEKLIYFKSFEPSINIISQRQILYPVYIFDVAFEEKKSAFDDIFCEAVYETISNVSSDDTTVAEFLALNINFVRFVKQRLIQKRYLDYNGNITETSRNTKERNESYSYSYGNIIVDGIQGRTLRFINDYEEPLEVNREGWAIKTFQVGSAGTSRQINVYRQIPFNNKLTVRQPSDFEVKGAAKNTYMNGRVSVTPNSKSAYLCLDIMLQDGYSDEVLVSDGFGESYSPVYIAEYINRQEWINNFKKSALTRYASSKDDVFNGEFDKYHSIRMRLSKPDNVSATTQAEQLRREKLLSEKLSALFDVLEEGIKVINYEFPADNAELLALESNSANKNQNELKRIASNIGFDVSNLTSVFFNIETKRISKPSELRGMLAYALVAAKNESAHPFYALAKENEEMLSYAHELKFKRDGIEHNAGQTITSGEYEVLRAQTERVICCLLKDYNSGISEQTSQVTSDFNNAELKATIDLEKDLGIRYCRIMQEKYSGIYKELKSIYNPRYIPDPSDYAKLMQSEFLVLRDKLLVISNETQGHYKRMALEKVKVFKSEIPQSLRTVREGFVESGVKGKTTTLGGVFLSIFYLAENNMITDMLNRVKNMIENVARLCVLRGHSNVATPDEQYELKQKFRPMLINLVKYVLED